MRRLFLDEISALFQLQTRIENLNKNLPTAAFFLSSRGLNPLWYLSVQGCAGGYFSPRSDGRAQLSFDRGGQIRAGKPQAAEGWRNIVINP